jgi:GMP synthase (glutamine-hydrolysing)
MGREQSLKNRATHGAGAENCDGRKVQGRFLGHVHILGLGLTASREAAASNVIKGDGLVRKNALVFQHDPTIHLGNLEQVLVEAGYDLTVVDARSYAFDARPEDVDLVVVLGNDHGVYEKDDHPYIAREEAWLAARAAHERPTLGVCFGAQILASALGAEVYRGDTTVVGFREVTPTPAGQSSPVRFFSDVPVMQWHGDTFTLPDGATHLAGSNEYANEAFAVDDWALAVQFHPETTPEMHEKWLSDSPEWVETAGYDIEALRREREKHSDAMQVASQAMLTEWLANLEKKR